MNTEQPIQYVSQPSPGVSPVPENVISPLAPKVGRSRLFNWIGIALVIIMVTAIGIILTRQEATNQASAASIPAGQVTVQPNGVFSPQTIRVKAGQSVVWTNQGGDISNLAVSDGSDLKADLLSGTQLYAGETFSYVFTQPGTYHFYDATSPLRSANTVIVE